MNELTRILKTISEKFPTRNRHIEILFEQNADFQLLCLDYVRSLEALKRYRQEYDDQKHTVEEFKTIIGELEKEFNKFI